MSIQQYDAQKVISALAAEIKQLPECKMPEWAGFVKTGVGRQGPPTDSDWWYVRSASILRKVAVLGPIGVNKLRRFYGGKKRNGYAPAHFARGSGKIIRVILQQLTAAGLIKEQAISGHKGKVVDTKGTTLLSKVAKTTVVKAESKKEKAPKAEEKVVEEAAAEVEE